MIANGNLQTSLIKGSIAYGAFLAVYFHNHHFSNSYEKAITVTFVSIIFGNYANILSTRTYGNALGKYFFSNRNLLLGFALSIFCVLLIVYVPLFNLYFRTSSLMPVDWLFPLTAGGLCLAIYEHRKKLINKRYNNGTFTSS